MSLISRRKLIQTLLSTAAGSVLPVSKSFGKTAGHKALFWKKGSSGSQTVCGLCPNKCLLKNGESGICRVRENINGKMVTHGYANPCAVHIDPIEKKPLYHVIPSSRVYSIAVAGCNLRCRNCQNYTISQTSPLKTINRQLTPGEVVKNAVKQGCSAIAYTYSEPSVWYEYMLDTAKAARESGLKNLWITNGYINTGPLAELSKYMDAANIDLKSFDDNIYKKLNKGRLGPVLESLKTARNNGIWIEVTNLVVPEWTDDIKMIGSMCDWIADNLGSETPIHFSRFHPVYKLAHLYPTPERILKEAEKTAKKSGLQHVYTGNLPGSDTSTYCPSCKKTVLKRWGYIIKDNNIINGCCSFCGAKIAGIWS